MKREKVLKTMLDYVKTIDKIYEAYFNRAIITNQWTSYSLKSVQ